MASGRRRRGGDKPPVCIVVYKRALRYVVRFDSSIRGGRIPLPDRAECGADHVLARAASFMTVFQLRPVPRVSSFFSMIAVVRRERPIPSG